MLISAIVLLIVSVVIAVAILWCRHCTDRNRSTGRHRTSEKSKRRRRDPSSNDQTHLSTSGTPCSSSAYSLPSSQHLFLKQQEAHQQIPSLVPSVNTSTSMVPSLRPATIDDRRLFARLGVVSNEIHRSETIQFLLVHRPSFHVE